MIRETKKGDLCQCYNCKSYPNCWFYKKYGNQCPPCNDYEED